MKKYLCLLLAFALCLIVCACGSSDTTQSTEVAMQTAPETTVPETTVPEPTEPAPEDVLRELAKNFDDNAISQMVQWQNSSQNQGSFTIQDNWIYGMGTDETGRSVAFIKCRLDFTEKTVLEKAWVYFPYVRDGYIYYMLHSFNNASDDGLYRMRISGSGREKLSDMFGHMQVWGDTIYVSYENTENEAEANHLYAMNMDGSNVRELISKPVFHWFVFGDAILYQDDQDNESLHIVDTAGNDTKLNDDISYFPIFDGEHIYYVKNINDERSIWRVDVDGQNDILIGNYHASNGFVLHKDKIYFVYQDDGNRIYSINKDGSNLTLITQDEDCSELQFIGNLLKYSDWKQNGTKRYIEAILLCEEDGTELVDFGKIK